MAIVSLGPRFLLVASIAVLGVATVVCCVAGAVLTLRDFAPGATPLRYTFPAFCLDPSRNFVNVGAHCASVRHGPM